MRRRTIQLHVMLTGAEAERVERVAAKYGLDTSSLVRMLIKREDDSCGPRPTGGPLGPGETESEAEPPQRTVEWEEP